MTSLKQHFAELGLNGSIDISTVTTFGPVYIQIMSQYSETPNASAAFIQVLFGLEFTKISPDKLQEIQKVFNASTSLEQKQLISWLANHKIKILFEEARAFELNDNIVSVCKPIINYTQILLSENKISFENALEIFSKAAKFMFAPNIPENRTNLERLGVKFKDPSFFGELGLLIQKAIGVVLAYFSSNFGQKIADSARAQLGIKNSFFAVTHLPQTISENINETDLLRKPL